MNCACGRPLHYNSSMSQDAVEKLSNKLGEFTTISVGGNKYKVQRHYIALHGIAAANLEELANQGVVERI